MNFSFKICPIKFRVWILSLPLSIPKLDEPKASKDYSFFNPENFLDLLYVDSLD
jgi:hypothetical protein